MLYNRCTGIYKFGNNTYPQCIRRRSNLGHFFGEKSATHGLGNMVSCTLPNGVRVVSELNGSLKVQKRQDL
jgi:hypothetical protein